MFECIAVPTMLYGTHTNRSTVVDMKCLRAICGVIVRGIKVREECGLKECIGLKVLKSIKECFCKILLVTPGS